jgi:hypothetical protein
VCFAVSLLPNVTIIALREYEFWNYANTHANRGNVAAGVAVHRYATAPKNAPSSGIFNPVCSASGRMCHTMSPEISSRCIIACRLQGRCSLHDARRRGVISWRPEWSFYGCQASFHGALKVIVLSASVISWCLKVIVCSSSVISLRPEGHCTAKRHFMGRPEGHCMAAEVLISWRPEGHCCMAAKRHFMVPEGHCMAAQALI